MTDYTPPPQPATDAITAAAMVSAAQATQAIVNVLDAMRQYAADTDAAAAEFTGIINTGE
jgi:hypothetical protein